MAARLGEAGDGDGGARVGATRVTPRGAKRGQQIDVRVTP